VSTLNTSDFDDAFRALLTSWNRTPAWTGELSVVERLIALCKSLGIASPQFYHVPSDYYSWSLHRRAAILGGAH
jgi:hypothetical protein